MRSPRVSATFLLVVSALMLLSSAVFGCAGPPNAINASAIDVPLMDVLTRHDRYVQQDAALSDVQRRTALRSSQLLKTLQDTAMKRADQPTAPTGPPPGAPASGAPPTPANVPR